jgi:uncharacterized protein (DUF2336 family)
MVAQPFRESLVAITRAALTETDIRTLVRGSTEDERAAAAHRLCRKIDSGVPEDERPAAEEVLRLLAEDAAELVRRALAVTLKTSPALPRDVALRLAKDVDSVATPVLAGSPAFTDEDLVEIVRASSALKQIAIARRELLSETVTDAIARHGEEDAVKAAVANDNAAFSERTLTTVIDRFARSEGVTTAVAYRKVLPLSISERLVDLVTEGVRQHLMDRHQLSPDTALTIALGARERATMDLVDQAGRAADLKAFTAHLNRQERLTPSLLLRALAHGHVSFFEWSVAELSGVPHHRVWLMVHDAGPLGLRAIYERAGLPPRLFPAFRAGLDTYHALQMEGAPFSLAKFQDRMLQRFLTQPHAGGREDADYLLEKIDRLSRPPAPAERERAIA